jgi:uncharacterized protein DUF3592
VDLQRIAAAVTFPYQRAEHRLRFFLVIGGVLCAAAFAWLAMTGLFVLRAAQAPGVVEQLAAISDSSESECSLSFTDAGGLKRQATTCYMRIASTKTLKPGDSVPVLYDPAAPTDVRLDLFAGVWARPLLLAFVGLGFVVVPSLMIAGVRLMAHKAQEAEQPTAGAN